MNLPKLGKVSCPCDEILTQGRCAWGSGTALPAPSPNQDLILPLPGASGLVRQSYSSVCAQGTLVAVIFTSLTYKGRLRARVSAHTSAAPMLLAAAVRGTARLRQPAQEQSTGTSLLCYARACLQFHLTATAAPTSQLTANEGSG